MNFRDYQIQSRDRLIPNVVNHRFGIDMSETGTGKTFTAIATSLELEVESDQIVVICRPSVVTKWRETFALFGLEPRHIISWDRARKFSDLFIPIKSRKKVRAFNFHWPANRGPALVICDEVQAAGGLKSQNSELLIAIRRCPRAHILALSATPADSPLKMRALGFCAGLHNLTDFWPWCRKNGCGESPFGGLYFRKRGREKILENLHSALAERGVRLRKRDLMDTGQFPANEVFVETWDVSPPPSWLTPWIKTLDEREDADLERHEDAPPSGVAAMRERQHHELMKIPALVEEIESLVGEGCSVPVFLQFTDSIMATHECLSKSLEAPVGILNGIDRKRSIESLRQFQANESRVLLCQAQAGSDSVDMHDLDGGHPRHVIIFPMYSAVQLIQATGRAVRDGTKSPVVQRLIYASGGVEGKIARKLESRLENMSMITDGILTAGGML